MELHIKKRVHPLGKSHRSSREFPDGLINYIKNWDVITHTTTMNYALRAGGGEGKYFGQGSKYFPPPLAYFFQIFLILLIFSTSRGCFWPIYLPLAKRKGEHHGRTLSSSYPCLSDPVELVKRKQPNGPRIAFSAPKH